MSSGRQHKDSHERTAGHNYYSSPRCESGRLCTVGCTIYLFFVAEKKSNTKTCSYSLHNSSEAHLLRGSSFFLKSIFPHPYREKLHRRTKIGSSHQGQVNNTRARTCRQKTKIFSGKTGHAWDAPRRLRIETNASVSYAPSPRTHGCDKLSGLETRVDRARTSRVLFRAYNLIDSMTDRLAPKTCLTHSSVKYLVNSRVQHTRGQFIPRPSNLPCGRSHSYYDDRWSIRFG